MRELFLSPELTIIAKDKGFNDKCLAYYINENDGKGWELFFEGGTFLARDYGQNIPAPTHIQIIYWLKEKHNLFIEINMTAPMPSYDEEYHYSIKWTRTGARIIIETGFTYYQALEKGIEQAFKLIK